MLSLNFPLTRIFDALLNVKLSRCISQLRSANQKRIHSSATLLRCFNSQSRSVIWRKSYSYMGKMYSTEGSTSQKSNRLAKEKSPYLLQHQNNPVDWYPWGQEAFEKARSENKLIFLSIGYSTCHWCHVMERESFENADIAEIMNKHFVCIKVDREERPDVDRIYMTFIQATQGGGGWPLNVFLTPDLKPITGGTYFPPADRWNQPGFPSILQRIAKIWKEKRTDVERQSHELMEALRKGTTAQANTTNLPVDRQSIQKCLKDLAKHFDKNEGGFEKAPKFPQPVNLNFLLRASMFSDCDAKKALEMCYKTLDGMVHGGIHDHLGYGFHRYSTDEIWHVPHFEKMLYDNAQLLVAYVEAFQVCQNPEYELTARNIMKYIIRDMTDPSGGIYSAEDADSYATSDSKHKTEGAFYVWKESEIDEILGSQSERSRDVKYSVIFKHHYGVKKDGNVDPYQDPHGELTHQNVLLVRGSLVHTAEEFGLTAEQVRDILAECRDILFAVRERRPRPHLDDKMIAAWNGLMMSGFARAAQALQDDNVKEKAISIKKFIRKYLYDESRNVVLHSVYEGSPEPSQINQPIDGFCEDYACVIRALLDLYECCYDIQCLQWAKELQMKQDELFWDNEHGGYFSSHGQDLTLLLRLKEEADGAEPSPNSVSAGNLVRLALLFGSDEWQTKAQRLFSAFSQRISEMPRAVPEMVSAFMFFQKPAQVVICGEETDSKVASLIKVAQTVFSPFKSVILLDRKNADFFKDFGLAALDSAGRTSTGSVHICRDKTCGAPFSSPGELQKQLKELIV